MNKKILLIASILTLFILFNITLAEDRFVLGAKSGAGYGLVGLELEKEFSNQFSILGGVGYTSQAFSLTVGFRYYFAQTGSRLFVSPFFSVITGMGEPSAIPAYGAAVGYEWRINPQFRVTVEGGLGIAIFIPIPVFGLSLGYIF